MSQALAVITQNRSHQTFRVGYDMQVAPLVAGEREQLAHYADVKSRLYGASAGARPRIVRSLRLISAPLPATEAPAPHPEPAARAAVTVVAKEDPIKPGKAPLNMMTLCSWRFLVALAAVKHRQSIADIMSHNRTQPVAKARHEAVYLIALHTTHSLARIARYLGRDHTTIINSLKHFPPFERSRRNLYGFAQALPRPDVPGIPKGASRHQAIEVGYSKGISPSDIARAIGSTPGSVKATASVRRLSRPNIRTKAKFDWETVGL